MKNLFSLAVVALLISCSGVKSDDMAATYTNPVIDNNAPDPTVIRAKDGTFYAYSTMMYGNVPVYKSQDMINWEYIGGAFRKGEVPKFVPKANIWAPDINYIEGKYVLYFSMSTWGGEWEAGIGRAVADSPEGPFTNAKLLFNSKQIGVQNSIDPVVFQEDGRKYLIWGSFRGIYLTELTEDGLELIDSKDLLKIAGTAYEGTYILKRKGYYYLFASIGSCCNGLNSTYQTVVGRSKSLFGPYVDKQGRKMLDNYHEILLSGDDAVKGPGHDSQILTDDKGQDWIYYHGVDVNEVKAGRKMYLDQVNWGKDGWPTIGNGYPAKQGKVPSIKLKR
ncbi:MAG: family 43 glycosylhydrolase [Alistipes sp.]|nr:family 43 glycosylhydrolase [Alistipes sp.]